MMSKIALFAIVGFFGQAFAQCPVEVEPKSKGGKQAVFLTVDVMEFFGQAGWQVELTFDKSVKEISAPDVRFEKQADGKTWLGMNTDCDRRWEKKIILPLMIQNHGAGDAALVSAKVASVLTNPETNEQAKVELCKVPEPPKSKAGPCKDFYDVGTNDIGHGCSNEYAPNGKLTIFHPEEITSYEFVVTMSETSGYMTMSRANPGRQAGKRGLKEYTFRSYDWDPQLNGEKTFRDFKVTYNKKCGNQPIPVPVKIVVKHQKKTYTVCDDTA